MCKNFSYKARPDGGYDCTTEIIAAGEIIETLKGQMYVAPKDLANSNAITIAQNTGGFNFTSEKRRAADFLEVGLQDFHNFSLAVDRNTDDEGDQRSNFSMEFYQVFGGDETWNFWDFGDDIEAKIKALKRLSKGKLSKPSPVKHLGDYFGYNDLSDDELEELGYEGDSHRELVLDALKTVILTKDSYFPRGDSEGYYINAAYIRWDAMCNYMNRFVINKDGFGKP